MKVDFDGVEGAKRSKSGNFVRPADMICRIDCIKEGENRKHVGFIANEMTVLHMFEGEHCVGENVTHMLMQDKDSFLGNWKSMVMGITSCAEDEVTKEQSEIIVSEAQPLSGDVVRVKARNITTRDGNPFTIVDYHGAVAAEEWYPLLSDEDRVKCGIGAMAELGAEASTE